MSETADVGRRVIANTNFDITNVVPIEKEQEHFQNTLSVCFDTLAKHCGSCSDYSMLVDNNSLGLDFHPNVFTRDGIGILKAMEFASPLERYIKELLTYIGSRVDSTAKDGTTTAMMFAAKYIEIMLHDREALIKEVPSFKQRQRIMTTTSEKFNELVKSTALYTDLMDETKYTEQEAMKIAGRIAFIQALSSSGGNLQLALAMKEIFEQSPRCMWNYITYSGSIKETDTAYSVEVPEYDYALKCTAALEGNLRSVYNSEYMATDVDCYIYANPLNDDSFALGVFTDELENLPDERDVLIISQRGVGPFYQLLRNLNSRRKHHITFWEYAAPDNIGGQNWPWELMILAAQCGKYPVDVAIERLLPIEPIRMSKVHWYSGSLHIYNTIPQETGTCLHPDYVHPEKAHPFFTESYTICKEQLNLYEQNHRPDGNMYEKFRDILSQLVTVRRPKLKLGGTTHEQLANRDVAQDVQGAIMATLKHGFVLGLIPFVSKLGEHANDTIYMGAIWSALSHVAHQLTKSDVEIPLADDQYVNVSDTIIQSTLTEFHQLLDEYFQNGGIELENKVLETYPPIQPTNIYTEIMKRTNELLFKFVNSSDIIVYGALMVKEDKDK